RGWSDRIGPWPGGRRFGSDGTAPQPGHERTRGSEGIGEGAGGSGPAQVIETLAQALATVPPWVWLVLAALAFAALLWWQRRRIAAAFRVIAALLARLVGWLSGLFRLRGGHESLPGLPRDPWADIFAAADPASLDPAVAVRHVWRAVQLFYSALGTSRADHETEMEFARRAPAAFGLRPEHVRRVAALYDACEYGGYLPAKNVVAEMAEIWLILLRAAARTKESAA
ncbi:MAG: DUF4129 domain-containing protein, partial [Armatimonadetes bacterium]|nr:DUF4129 domain-containing protein [Armatimonadota bacterium]